LISRAVSSLFLLLAFSGCSNSEALAPLQPPDEIPSREYAVLAAVVDSLLVHLSDTTLIVRDSTTSGIFSYDLDTALANTLLLVQQSSTALKEETMRDFKTKNLIHTYIQDPSRIHPRCVRASTAGLSYPIFDVGRVGFSGDGQQALAYVGFSSAPLAGSGHYYVLSQHYGRWIIIGQYMIWIS
jgi:hypothetical protein